MTPFLRSMMVSAGDDQAKIESFTRAAADCYLLDLEHAVPEDRKSIARSVAVNAMSLDWGRRTRGVRLNEVTSEHFAADMDAIARAKPDYIMLVKVHTADEVTHAAKLLDAIPEAADIRLWAMIETCAAVQNVDQIAAASPRMQALFFGGGDYSVDLGTKKDSLRQGSPLVGHPRQVELLYARSRIATSAKAYGLKAIDPGEFIARNDAAASFDAALYAFQFGFDGVAAWSPEQIAQIHRAYAPFTEDLDWARKVVTGYEDAVRAGKDTADVEGVVIKGTHAKTARDLLQHSVDIAAWDAVMQAPRTHIR